MSSYRFTNSTTLGGKYVSNWPQGYNPQKYRWKRWSNSTGYDMFIPENTSSERSTVHSYLQNVSGVSRTVGWFGSADGRTIVTSVQKSANSFYCHFGVPGAPGDAEQYGYATANACPGGTTDRFGSVYGNSLESLSESQDNPYYNTAASSNTATNFYLSYRYTNSRDGSENVWDYNIVWCTDPTFPWRQYQIRQCYISADRGRCWDQCGNSIPSVVETLVVAGGGGGGGSQRQYWEGGEQCYIDPETFEEICSYVGPYNYIYTGGGGGAGGYRTANVFIEVNTTYSVTVGGGGTGGSGASVGSNGTNSIFSTIVTQGGGGGGGAATAGRNGGSGGGGGAYYDGSTWTTYSGGTGNTSPQQGFNGGNGGSNNHGGGGGGASEAGNTDGQGEGGDGSSSSISGSAVTRAGGGAGSRLTTGTNNGGDGGGGSSVFNTNGTNGTTNLGAGGGGAGVPSAVNGEIVQKNGGNGSAGVIIIRYPNFLSNATSTTGSPTFTNSDGYKVYTFTGAGSIMWRDTVA